MKHSIRGYTFLLCAVVLSCLVMSGRKIDVAMRTPQKYVCKFDDVLVASCQLEIQSFIQHIDKKIALQHAQLVAVITKQFPFIKSIKTHLVPPGTMELEFICTKPLCKINDNCLAVPPKFLLPRNLFQEQQCASLPMICCDDQVLKTIDQKQVVTIAKQITFAVFEHFDVILKSKDDLVFTDKLEPKLSLMCRVNKIPSASLCYYGNTVKGLLVTQGAFANRKVHNWLADLRFEKQIILSKR